MYSSIPGSVQAQALKICSNMELWQQRAAGLGIVEEIDYPLDDAEQDQLPFKSLLQESLDVEQLATCQWLLIKLQVYEASKRYALLFDDADATACIIDQPVNTALPAGLDSVMPQAVLWQYLESCDARYADAAGVSTCYLARH